MLLILAGCGASNQDALRDYIKAVKSRPETNIEPLPEVRPYSAFVYSADDLRDPFVKSNTGDLNNSLPADNGIRPDIDRPREPLESFSLDSLKMIGTLSKQGIPYAIIMDKEGVVYRVGLGNYIGQNHGRIEKIEEDNITIKEILPNGVGGWQERESVVSLAS